MPLIPDSSWDKWGRELENAITLEDAYKERIDLLKRVIETSRDEVFLAARTLQNFGNPTSIIGMDIYERLRKTHELLRKTVEILERGDSGKPK